MRTRDLKARAEELSVGYQEARDEEFHVQFQDMFMRVIDTELGDECILTGTLTEDDVQGFIDSFDFPDEDTWSFDAVQSELDTIGDQKYQEWKERDI